MNARIQERKEFIRKFLAGLFFIAGIALIVLVIFSLGKDKGIIQPKFRMTVLFNNVDGLIEGAPVLLSGVPVGTVNKIGFLDREIEGRKVKVDLNIFNEFRDQFDQGLSFAISTEGILGQKFIDVRRTVGGAPVVLDQPVLGEDTIDVRSLTTVFANAAESFTKISEEFSKIDTPALSGALKSAADSLVVTSQGMNEIFYEFKDMSLKSRRILDRVEQKLIDGNLFKVF